MLLFVGISGNAAAGEPRVVMAAVSENFQGGPYDLLLTAAAHKLGMPVQFRRAPFKRRLLMMKQGNADLTCGLLRRPERESYIHFVTPPYKTRSDTIFFVPLEHSGEIKTYADLKNMRIGVERGARYFHRFDNDPTLQKERARSKSNFNKLLLGRLDAVIQDESNGILLVHHMGVADKVAISPFRFSREKHVYFGISKKSWMIGALDQIQPRLEELIESGQARAIITGYFTSQGLPVPAM